LVAAGKLVLHGARRGAFYRAPSVGMNEFKPDMKKSITKSKLSKPGRRA
jgi:hypothetical protein